MTRQSLLAPTFRQFWQRWNPLFSYYLLYHCYRPLQRIVPAGLALMLTFAVSGAIHDLAASLVKGQIIFLFTPTFIAYSLAVLLESTTGWSLQALPPLLRPSYHLSLIVGLFLLVRQLSESLIA